MCELCQPIDAQLERYRNLKSLITDNQALEAIVRLSEKLEAQKRALHPDDDARTEEARRVAQQHVEDQREIISKLPKPPKDS